jgi:hypothetical protein
MEWWNNAKTALNNHLNAAEAALIPFHALIAQAEKSWLTAMKYSRGTARTA